jgi:hypothetical protein
MNTNFNMTYEETECPNCEEISFVKECSECGMEICEICEDPEYNMCSECRKIIDSQKNEF